MTHRRKTVLFFASVVLLLLVAGVVLIYAALCLDDPPHDDSDLAVARLKIPDEENGFTFFVKASEVLCWKDYRPPAAERRAAPSADPAGEPADKPEDSAAEEPDIQVRLNELARGKNWDDALAADVLARNEEALALLEKGLACPHVQAPEARNFSELLPYNLVDFAQLPLLLSLRARALARSGREEAALEEAFKVIRFGDSLQHAKGSAYPFMVGLHASAQGCWTFRQLLATTALPAERLEPFAFRLAALRDGKEGLADALRAEYQLCRKAIEDFPNEKTLPELPRVPQFFLRRNKTLRIMAEGFRGAIANAHRPASEKQPILVGIKTRYGDLGTMVKLLIGGNATGEILISVLCSSCDYVLDVHCQIGAEWSATQAMAALKCYRTKTGRLPETLDALVPDYLPAVPLDPFDGKPLRYSPAKRCLYSVGEDLVDGGGLSAAEIDAWWRAHYRYHEGEEPDVGDAPDPSFPIEF